MLKFAVLYSFIKLFVLCRSFEDETAVNSEQYVNEDYYEPSGFDSGDSSTNKEYEDEENSVLDSVYDTMKHNYEIKLRQNLHKLNVISDIRNKRNVNEPMNMNALNAMNSMNSAEFYKNHQYDVNRKVPVNFPLGFKTPPRLMPITSPSEPLRRSDYEYEE